MPGVRSHIQCTDRWPAGKGSGSIKLKRSAMGHDRRAAVGLNMARSAALLGRQRFIGPPKTEQRLADYRGRSFRPKDTPRLLSSGRSILAEGLPPDVCHRLDQIFQRRPGPGLNEQHGRHSRQQRRTSRRLQGNRINDRLRLVV